MTQAAVTQTAAVTTEISNSKDDSNNMTTHNSRNAGRVYIMVSCGAPEGVYSKRPVLLLDMSTLQRAVLHLHMDVSTPQRPELHLDLYTSVVCAGPGQRKGDRQQHSPEHLL